MFEYIGPEVVFYPFGLTFRNLIFIKKIDVMGTELIHYCFIGFIKYLTELLNLGQCLFEKQSGLGMTVVFLVNHDLSFEFGNLYLEKLILITGVDSQKTDSFYNRNGRILSLLKYSFIERYPAEFFWHKLFIFHFVSL